MPSMEVRGPFPPLPWPETLIMPGYSADEILEKAKNGELTSRNGYMIEWDDVRTSASVVKLLLTLPMQDCVRATELEKWRRKGDDLCDGVVRCLGIGPGHDGLQMLLDYLDRTPEQARDPRVTAFWDEVSRPPPPAISGFASVSGEKGEVPLAEATPVTSLNRLTRYPPRTVAGGQAVFWRYSPEIFTALMHFSLAGGTLFLTLSAFGAELDLQASRHREWSLSFARRTT